MIEVLNITWIHDINLSASLFVCFFTTKQRFPESMFSASENRKKYCKNIARLAVGGGVVQLSWSIFRANYSES